MTSENTLTHKQIRLRIPKDYHQEPVISRLISDYGLIVNINAAMLGTDAIGDGWFNLNLQGTTAQIDRGLTYLNELGLEIWSDINTGTW